MEKGRGEEAGSWAAHASPVLFLQDPHIGLACFAFEYLGSKYFVFYHI